MFRKRMENKKKIDWLKIVFEKAEIRMSYNTRNDNVFIYPLIRDVVENEKKIIYTFTIPTGFNPELIYSKAYCFRQVFGEHVILSGDDKSFTCTVYKENPFLCSVTFDIDLVRNQSKNLRIPIVSGLDSEGNFLMYDMVRYPHLLIAGETGSGKSTAIRAILTTLITCKKPNELHLYLGDLKRSELHLFRNIEHVKGLHTDKGDLIQVLGEVQDELSFRGKLLDEYELSNIDEYNKQTGKKLPYIVICIDEVAMLHGNDDVMEVLDDIAAVGRALGVFLITSMQRPDSEVLNSRLKSNLTVRMAFKTTDEINSRIILGVGGAEEIEQVGRMLLKLEKIQPIQFPELSLDNAKKLLSPFKMNPKTIQRAAGRERTVWGCLG